MSSTRGDRKRRKKDVSLNRTGPTKTGAAASHRPGRRGEEEQGRKTNKERSGGKEKSRQRETKNVTILKVKNGQDERGGERQTDQTNP